MTSYACWNLLSLQCSQCFCKRNGPIIIQLNWSKFLIDTIIWYYLPNLIQGVKSQNCTMYTPVNLCFYSFKYENWHNEQSQIPISFLTKDKGLRFHKNRFESFPCIQFSIWLSRLVTKALLHKSKKCKIYNILLQKSWWNLSAIGLLQQHRQHDFICRLWLELR